MCLRKKINLSVMIFCDFQFWTLFHFFSGSGRTSSRPTICCSGQPVGHRSSPTSHPRNVETFFYFGKNVLVSLFCWSLGPHDCWPPIFSPSTSTRRRPFFGEISLCDIFLFLPSSCWPSWLLGHRSSPHIHPTMFYSLRIFIFSVAAPPPSRPPFSKRKE